MKPLKRGRQAFIWLGINIADDEPTSWRQKLAQKTFTISFIMLFITAAIFHLRTFLKLQLTDPEELFFVLIQVMMAIQTSFNFVLIYSCASRISTVFQYLTEIYEKCKQNHRLNFKTETFGDERFFLNLNGFFSFKILMNVS